MPTFKGLDPSKRRLAYESHTKRNVQNNDNIDKIFNLIARGIASGQRNMTYSFIASMTDMPQNRVKYYIEKLTQCGAISKDQGSPQANNHHRKGACK